MKSRSLPCGSSFPIKNNFGIEEFLDDIRMPKTCREAFIRMPQLFGNAEVLKEARRLADNSRSIGAIERLEAVYHALKLYDLTDYVSLTNLGTGQPNLNLTPAA